MHKLTPLARGKHGSQGGLLSGSDGEVVDGLDLDPHLGVGAVVGSYSSQSALLLYHVEGKACGPTAAQRQNKRFES